MLRAPLVSALEALLQPQSRHRNDESAERECRARVSALGLPQGLSVTWLGTAGFVLEYQGYALVLDPYLTRPALRRVVGARRLRTDPALIRRHVPRADAVLVGHTHFDHALDVPALAALHRARAYGSRSLCHLMGLHGLSSLATRVEPKRVYELGPFQVTFIPSLHSKLLLGWKVPSDGELTCDHLDGLRGAEFRCGETYGIHIAVAGVTFYHQGSANLIEEQIPYSSVDYFLMGIAGRVFTREYTARVLRVLSPRVIVPQHYDNFFRPLDSRPGFSLNVNFGGFLEEVRDVSADFEVCALPLSAAVGTRQPDSAH